MPAESAGGAKPAGSASAGTEAQTPALLFVGMGSPHGDDAVGWAVAAELLRRGATELSIRTALAPIDLIDWLDHSPQLWICDACQGLTAPGAWQRWQWPAVDVRLENASGTHDFGLPAVLELAARLGRVTAPPVVWGIEVERCGVSEQMSPAVAQAVAAVADDILRSAQSARDAANGVRDRRSDLGRFPDDTTTTDA